VLVEARGISKAYPGVRALEGVDLDVREGEIFGLFGPNGAGKTTAIRVLTGLTRPTQGDARVCGVDVRESPREVRQFVGIQFDIPILYEKMRFADYLRFFGKMAGLRGAELEQRLGEVFATLEQPHNAHRKIGSLSMGERQRVEIGRVLMSDAQLLFLDEPFSNVDVDMRMKLRARLRAWLAAGRSIFFTSHNLLEAEQFVDRFAFLAHGRITAIGTPRDLKERLLAPVYHVVVSDVSKALAVLRGIPSHELKQVGGDALQIVLMERGDARRIARALTEAGVDLLELRSVGTMEDVFQQATQPRGPPPPPGAGS